MSAQLVDIIKNPSNKFSIVTEEGTVLSNKICLIIFIRIPNEGDNCNSFQLLEMQSCNGVAIYDILL